MASTSSERGIALVVVLLILVVISQLVLVLLATVRVESKLSGHGARETAALQIAEAGVSEAVGRIKSQEIAFNGNPRGVGQIFNVVPGAVPVLGADSIALPTAQPAGQWLSYSSPGRGSGTLTVTYKTDAARSVVYKYDMTQNPAVQTTSGAPIYVVTSTGHKGADVRTIVAEVMARPFLFAVRGAFATGVPIILSGSSVVCGYNHVSNTPTGTGTSGRTGLVGSCNESPQHWETGAGDLAGVWSTGNITGLGNGYQYGTPNLSPNQTGFYSGPWDMLGIKQAEFFAWVGAPQAFAPQPPKGIVYLDNNIQTQDQSGGWAYQGGDGEGMLYVDGDLTLNGNFSYRGLIYVEGDIAVNGSAWVLGGMVCRGKTVIKLANGNLTVLYSYASILENITKYGDQFINLSWREF